MGLYRVVMGLIAQVKSFARAVRNGAKLSSVKVDPGGGANITGDHFADAGDDSHPLDTDYAALLSTQRSGGYAPVGYADPVNDPKAGAGEKRIYGRDPSTGLAVNEVWLKADGSVIISNALGAIELKADGSVDINGATITTIGGVVTALGRDLDTHLHSGVTSGGQTSGPPV